MLGDGKLAPLAHTGPHEFANDRSFIWKGSRGPAGLFGAGIRGCGAAGVCYVWGVSMGDYNGRLWAWGGRGVGGGGAIPFSKFVWVNI